MKLKKTKNLASACISLVLYFPTINMAATDTEAQENFLRARVRTLEQGSDHTSHVNHDRSKDFHGVFYGFLPCIDCNGIKTTMSLKQNNNYLIVTQYARESSREYYEKGKYEWNDESKILLLTPRDGSEARKYRIQDEGTIAQLNKDGSDISGTEADRYILRRSDTMKSREVHIH